MDATFAHFFGENVANIAVEAAQKKLVPVELRCPRPQAVKNPGKFDTDVTAADDDHFLRQARKIECLVGSDRMFATGKLRHHRPAADGDENIFRANLFSADGYHVFVG